MTETETLFEISARMNGICAMRLYLTFLSLADENNLVTIDARNLRTTAYIGSASSVSIAINNLRKLGLVKKLIDGRTSTPKRPSTYKVTPINEWRITPLGTW